MIATDSKVALVSFYINGAWETPRGRTMGTVTNPATGAVLAEVPYANAADVDSAVRTAHAAFLKWRVVPVIDRVQVLYRYKTLLDKYSNDLAAILTSENGKTTEDARKEVRRMIQMVEVACGMPSLMMGDSLNDVAAGLDCKTIRQPIGVCAGITPFDFPAMVPMWIHPFAIACGNSFILKPSEKVPLTPTRAIELLHDAGLPPGVLNLIHGDKDSVDALLHHPLVKAVSFVGSTPVAKYIYATAAAEGKRVQALGGAKNHLIVMPDADMPKTVEAIIGSAFGAAGERCLAGSVLVPVGDAAGPLLELLVARTRSLAVGDGSAPGIEMGPLVTGEHCKRVESYVEKGVAEGATPLVGAREPHLGAPRRHPSSARGRPPTGWRLRRRLSRRSFRRAGSDRRSPAGPSRCQALRHRPRRATWCGRRAVRAEGRRHRLRGPARYPPDSARRPSARTARRPHQ